MRYDYQHATSPDLDAMESAILSSSIASLYSFFRWDEDDGLLKCFMTRELDAAEKAVLDSIAQ